MIKITDELLNRFLDGELGGDEAVQVKSALQSSEELKRKFIALKLIHDKLSDLKEDETSAGFTNRVMKQIAVGKFVTPRQQRYFIASIASFITLLCLVIFGFSIAALISSASSSADGSKSVFDSISIFSETLVSTLNAVFSGKGLSILGSIFSLLVIVSGYFLFEILKRSKANLGNGHHI